MPRHTKLHIPAKSHPKWMSTHPKRQLIPCIEDPWEDQPANENAEEDESEAT